jgi:hypothetical protein
MINKPFEQITKQDLEDLVSNAVSESRTLEYKEGLPSGLDAEKKEFLADISSFANASGGDVVYGVREQRDQDGRATGIPESVLGLGGINGDAEIRRLENIIRDGIERRINGIRVTTIAGFSRGPAIILRVSKSWASPHMVTFKSESRFYSRTSAGKYPLDVTEIRSAFALAEALPEKIRQFRDGRLCKVVAGETPLPLEETPKIVLHLVPLSAFAGPQSQTFDVQRIKNEAPGKLSLIGMSSSYSRVNLDGLVAYAFGRSTSVAAAYVQLFRSAAIEAVDCFLLGRYAPSKIIPGIMLEHNIVQALSGYLELLKNLEVPTPLILMLTFLGVQGFRVVPDSDSVAFDMFDSSGFSTRVDRDALLLPEIVVDDYAQEADRILRLTFDTLWQASGFDGSPNYDKDGKRLR